MIRPAAPYRIPRTPARAGRLVAPAVLLAILLPAACGPEAEPGDDAGEPEAATEPSDPAPSQAPPGTDVWLGDLATDGDAVVLSGLRNVTSRPGYDNQPAFLPDGSGFLYTVVDSTGQADIWRWDLASGRASRVTDTSPESEYSATPLPAGGGFSAVRVEADSTQRLWRFAMDGTGAAVLFPDVAPVGYHAWAGEEQVALFVLGDPPTLRIAGGGAGGAREVARDVGRSIQSIPGGDAVSFVQNVSGAASDTAAGTDGSGATRIMRWSEAGGVTPIRDAADGGDFHAWTPDGLLLMGRGADVVAWRDGWDGWRAVGAVPGGGTVSRLAVSPDGTRIAVVVERPGGG